MRSKLFGFAVALMVALGLAGDAPAQASVVAGAPVYLKGKSPADGSVIADDFRSRPKKGTAFAPPQKGSSSDKARLLVSCAGGGCHHYAQGDDDTNTNATIPSGVTANVTVSAPTVDTAPGEGVFSLVQFAVREITSGTQYVELGLAVYPALFGDTNVHVFGSKWVNGAWCGSYTGVGTCGGSWVDDAGNAINLGSSVQGDVGTIKQLTVQFLAGNWWLGYNGSWLGYFTTGGANNWPATFDQVRLFQAFWETTSNQDPLTTDCTDMGNGTLAVGLPTPAGPQIGSVTYRNAAQANLPSTDVNMNWSRSASPGTLTTTSQYNIAGLSTRTARGGGTGVC